MTSITWEVFNSGWQSQLPCLKRLTEASALALFIARALLVDHVDATSALDDLIVRADFFN